MLYTMLKAKLHKACVVQAEVNYDGSIAIDKALLDFSGILEHEQVQIYNITNGQRFTTYVIVAEENSGMISVNGAAALLVNPGDRIIICAYGLLPDHEAKKHTPKLVYLNDKNVIIDTKNI